MGVPSSHPCLQVRQEELSRTTLQVRVLSFRHFSAHEPLGGLSLPLGAVDPQHVLEQWCQLGPPGATEVRPRTAGLQPGPALGAPRETEAPSRCPQPERSGELCFSLRYVPSSGQLTVVVLEAQGLSLGLAGESRTCPSAWRGAPRARPSDLAHL